MFIRNTGNQNFFTFIAFSVYIVAWAMKGP